MFQANDVDLYARISLDPDQIKGSTENQLKVLQQHAADKGWTIHQIYKDESLSATSGVRRPAFEELLERTVQRPVLVWATDRLIRGMKDLERVLDTKMTVHAVQAGELNLATAQGRANARILTSISAMEGELKSERMKVANLARAGKGLPHWRNPPFGHRADGTADPEHKERIAEAIKDVIAGKSVYGITKQWNDDGVKPPKQAQVWRASSVRSILRAPRMAGLLVFKGEQMPISQLEPIVPEKTWRTLMGVLDSPERIPKAGGRVSTLLSSIAECGYCLDGTTMNSGTRTNKAAGPNTDIYRCRTKRHCEIERTEAEGRVLAEVFEYLTSTNTDELLRDKTVSESAALEASTLRGQLKTWEAAATEIGPAEYLRVTKPLREKLAAAEKAMQSQVQLNLFKGLVPASMDLNDSMEVVLDQVAPWWESLDLSRRRSILQSTFKIVILPPGQGEGVSRVEITPK